MSAKLIWLSLLSVIILLGVFTARAQTTSPNALPTPQVSYKIQAGSEGSTPDEGTTGAVITATIPEDQQCECGARFEAKLSDSSDWTALGLAAPMETGDDYEQYQWFYASNFFEMDKTYDVRALIYDRLGAQSEYGQNQFSMKPDQENPCSDNTFSNLKKESYGEGDNAVILLSWDKVCTHQKTANKYVVYKNGEKIGETDQGANNFAIPGAPDGSTWKIEASGDEPPSANMDVIKNCDTVDPNGNVTYSEIVTKMAAKSVMVPVVKVNKCQIVGTWLRAIIEFQPWTNTQSVDCASPRAWLSCAMVGYHSYNGQPYFNFITGRIPIPGYPNQYYWNAFAMCGTEGQTVNNSNGAVTDPWNQLPDWRCNSSYTYGTNYSVSYTDRAWVNFDLTASGGSSVWPVTTTFTY
jgi:hypothetical protein